MVEVVSSRPSRDRVERLNVYFAHKVVWYWLIDPDTLAIEEYQLTDAGYLRNASVAAGLEFKPLLFPNLTLNLSALVDESM